MHKLMGLIVIARWKPLKYILISCLNVKATVFLCFWFIHILWFTLKNKKNKFVQVEVGSLDCRSLLKKHFVLQILE